MTTKVLDLIKRNQVPAAVLRTASKGALPLPAKEMIEILVYLTQNPVFAQDAKMTLASYDVLASVVVVADPATAPEVLGYYWTQPNRRPALMPHLIENPAISETLLMELAEEAPREIVNMLLASPRARSSPAIVEALCINARLTPEELRELQGETARAEEDQAGASESGPPVEESPPIDPETEAAQKLFIEQHAHDIASEEGKPFELAAVEGPADNGAENGEDAAVLAEEASRQQDSEAVTDANADVAKLVSTPDPGELTPQTQSLAATALAQSSAKQVPAQEGKKLTLLQKIARMNVADRVKTAFSGSREERGILIRDMTKVVQNAVLASPKLTDPEVETFASAKNLHENVFREITRNRRFIKNYAVQRNLVSNPKTPLDISLSLIKNLMVYDLKSLQRNKNVSETIRKLAQKLYREKATSGGKTKD